MPREDKQQKQQPQMAKPTLTIPSSVRGRAEMIADLVRARNPVGVLVEVATEGEAEAADVGAGGRRGRDKDKEAKGSKKAEIKTGGGTTAGSGSRPAGMLFAVPSRSLSGASIGAGAAIGMGSGGGVAMGALEMEYLCLCLTPPQEDGGVKAIEAKLDLLACPSAITDNRCVCLCVCVRREMVGGKARVREELVC